MDVLSYALSGLDRAVVIVLGVLALVAAGRLLFKRD
jgi:hypothetical protein